MGNIIKHPCTEGVIRGYYQSVDCSPSVGVWVLVATILGSSMAFIDGTVVNVALPALQAEFNATVIDVQWIVESYALFLAALILVGGSMGDKLGRRRVFAAGIAIFAVSSVFCGLAQNVQQLIIARAVQGIGAALLVPGSLAIIGSYFSEEGRGKAIGTWSSFSAITAAMGPVLGGWLIDNLSWRWIFFINLPIAVIVLVVLYSRVPESRDEESAVSIDYTGAILVTLGLAGVIYGLLESPVLDFSSWKELGAIIIGVVFLILFVVVEKYKEAPMLPLSLFSSPTVSGANLITLFLYAALGGVLFFLPFNFIQVQGFSATEAGAAFLPLILIIFLMSRQMGHVVDKYGARVPLIVGPVVAACGYILLSFPGTGANYWTDYFPGIVVLGIGIAACIAPLTTSVMSSVGTRFSGTASGVNNAVSRVAGLLAIAVFGIVLLHYFNGSLDIYMETAQMETEYISSVNDQRIRLAAMDMPTGMNTDTKITLRHAVNKSFVHGLRYVLYISAALSLLSAFIAFFTIRKNKEA